MSMANEINNVDADGTAVLPDAVSFDSDRISELVTDSSGQIICDEMGVSFPLPSKYRAYFYSIGDVKENLSSLDVNNISYKRRFTIFNSNKNKVHTLKNIDNMNKSKEFNLNIFNNNENDNFSRKRYSIKVSNNKPLFNKEKLINFSPKEVHKISIKKSNSPKNNNLNANTQIKTQFHNKINKDNNSIPAIKEENKIKNKGNIINENKDNNNKNTDSKNKRPNTKEKKNIFKSVIIPNEINNDNKENKENKVKNKKKEKINLKKEKENEKNKAEIMDKLKCYICIDKLKKPRMCKYCHRPACENCLKMWLNEKHQCGFCRKRINYNETIEIPIINDIADFFMKNINNQKEEVNNKKNDNKNEQKSFESEVYDSYSEISKLKLKEEDNLCQKHKNKYEYFCYQCNEKYCDKCLVICNNSSKMLSLMRSLEHIKFLDIYEELLWPSIRTLW